MPLLNTAERVALQNTSASFTANLKDELGVAVPQASIDTATLTFYDKLTGDIINNRLAQDINNNNNVTIHATSGLITWSMQKEDNPIMNPKRIPIGRTEKHVALFEFNYNTTGYAKAEVLIEVENINKVD